MPVDRLEAALAARLDELSAQGTRKRDEAVVVGVVAATADRGPRYILEGEGDRPFVRMNSNGYLGMALRPELVAAEEAATRTFGVGPQAVRFISGTSAPHVELESRLAAFHGREAAMLFSSAYAAVLGALSALSSPETAIVSDALNHNCIINGARMAQPAQRIVYAHNDPADLRRALASLDGGVRRALVVTDGVFSMRGDHAPLAAVATECESADGRLPEGAALVVDDSHGVGAFGATGRGTEEVTGTRADVLVATLGKAFGVNGGYVVGSRVLVDFLRETAPTYVYSNPVTPGEAMAAVASLEHLDSAAGLASLDHLRRMTAKFRTGLVELGYETLPGDHPVVPLLTRDTVLTHELVGHLREHGVLATGLGYPVVPRGDEEIRFQVCADHSDGDIGEVLGVLEQWPRRTQGTG